MLPEPAPEREWKTMKELTLEATLENLTQVTDFLGRELEAAGCPMKAQIAISIAAEEIYVNIAHYAYAPETGDAALCLELVPEPPAAVLTFRDRGVPFDPLAKPDPDVTLAAEDRAVGGLGIFIVKKTMSPVTYKRRSGLNILKMGKDYGD